MTNAFDGLPLLHTRNYDTEVYLDDATLKVVGSVRYVKPPGIYVKDDPNPLPIHHMTVVLSVSVDTLTITDVEVEFEVHPNTTCPSIIDHYRELIGVSVTRGFNRKVRELFGGPRGCTHTTALLQAMGPVVVQSMWSMRVLTMRASGAMEGDGPDRNPEHVLAANLNTCHVWHEDGDHIARLRAGEPMEAPVWIHNRLEELGRSLDEWTSPAQG